ncbi:hypothetical protein ABB37_05062 [Leptomonas pyrrhocoris]|uniref:Uncharacterized protein n=1 Tax=Leptomonas pyrrhocoris TaxID=157538 RepID=A0A0M9G0U8_LEPPY|nr:hypothetical protein ABB37_05062 [Leptomonas pyrrhocoris]KPA80045.1 hypothetical protein ABB37_05062 [Leptomonas pyrrhocoris]|eukprot:XP_015658484.1 hypothetical protein ABB37_05062 [Leptomonas pyrrhocoris]
MKFRVLGGPLTGGINLEAKHSDTFKSIFEKLEKAAGKKTPLDGYDLFTAAKSGSAGHYQPAAGPLHSTETPDSVELDRTQNDPHILLLVRREGPDAGGSMTRSLSESNSAVNGAGGLGREKETSPTSMSPMDTPRAKENYRRRMQAMFLKYDPAKVKKVDVALEHYAGFEEDVIQQLVKKYGPEPAAGELDTSPAAIASASRKPDNGASYRDRLIAIYSTYEPEKLSKVDGTLKRYAGREEEVIQQLLKKYGPEPPVPTATSPEPRVPAATASTATTIIMSEAPPTPMTGGAATTTAADSLPVTPRNLQDDYGSNTALTSAAPSAPVGTAPAASEGPLTYRDRLTAMYATYDPKKLRLVDGTLKKYKDREAMVLKQLVKMYGPEPSPEHIAAAKEAAASAARARKASDEAAAAATTAGDAGSSAAPPMGGGEHAEKRLASGAAPVSAVAEVAVTPSPIEDAATASSPPLDPSPVAPKGIETAANPIASDPELRAATPVLADGREEGGRYRERLLALYHTYNPSKLHTVEGTLKKFAGKEEVAIQQLVRRYGPEPPALTDAEVQELLQTVGSSSPMTSPRAPNATAKAIPAVVPDNASSSSSPYNSKPASPVEDDEVDREEEGEDRARYKGKGAEAAVTPEQRNGAHKSDGAEVTQRTAQASPVSPFVLMENTAAAAVITAPDPSQRPSTPPPAPMAVETAGFSAGVAALPSPTEAKTDVSDDDATRPTAPPSQRSSSYDSSRNAPAPQAEEEEEPEPLKEAAAPLPPHSTTTVTSKTAIGLPPASLRLQPHPVEKPVYQQHQPSLRANKFVAVAKVAADHLELFARKALLQRYWSSWCRHHVKAKADVLVRDELWVATTTTTSSYNTMNGRAVASHKRYQLNDTVQPSYTVADLSTVVAQEERRTTGSSAAFSSEVQIGARTLLSALRHCVESRVVEVRSAEEEELANRFLSHWKGADHLCPVTDSPEFARALHQAAHLIVQLDDLMTVIRTQAGQLQQLRNLHKDVVKRMEEMAQASDGDVERLQAQLDSANARRHELEEELKRAAAHPRPSARSPSAAGRKVNDTRKASPPTRRVYPTMEERKDAQIARLQQELAKTRNTLFASKEAEEKMKLKVQQSLAREARREREERRREGPPGHHTRPDSLSPQRRSYSGPAGQRGRHTSALSSPRRGYSASTTPRGAFSHAIVLDTPRRPCEAEAEVEHNGRAVSSIRKSARDAQERSNVSVNSNTPWPTSRFVVTEEIERGPCPNCLTPLTSCSPDAKGPANAKAAFCFSCRRSFTFGELRARDASDTLANL